MHFTGVARGSVGSVDSSSVPSPSPWLVAGFRWYCQRYLARHFHAVRRSRAGGVPTLDDGPLLVVLNHPAWWDPLVCAVLSEAFPERTHYAPMAAAMLERYPFFRRLGFFGVETSSWLSVRSFLKAALDVLTRPGAALWVTAQGEFTDPRCRPSGLRRGVGHLARSLPGGTVLPLALEYPFWQERTPEALTRFGEPLILGGADLSADEWTALIEERLEQAQDELAAEACRQDPSVFDRLLSGRAGVGGAYDLWRGVRSALTGQAFRREHGAEPSRGRGVR